MSTIPESVTEDQFRDYILPYLTRARRRYVSKVPLQGIFNLVLYRLHTGCQWDRLPRSTEAAERQRRNEPTWQAVYDHWRKWSVDGSLEKVWQESIRHIKDELDLRQMNLDGSHPIAKKGGESVAYQARKRAKTSNILPITDSNGYVVCGGCYRCHSG